MANINYNELGKEFIETIRNRGLGTFTKRELDILIVHLLQKHSDLSTLSNGDLGLWLRTPDSRIKSLRMEASLRYSKDLNQEFRTRLSALLRHAKLQAASDNLTLVIEDTFTRNILLSELKKKGSYGEWSFNSELVTVKVDALFNVLVDQIPEAEIDIARKALGATTTAQAKEKLRKGGKAILDGLKDKAIDGVVTMSSETIMAAAKVVIPQIAATAIRLLLGL